MFERSTAPAVGEEAEVANANQPLGQNVDEEASQELIRGNGHDLLLAAVSIVSPAEGDAIVLEGHETMVGDGDAVGIAGQVVENMFGARISRIQNKVTLIGFLGSDAEVRTNDNRSFTTLSPIRRQAVASDAYSRG